MLRPTGCCVVFGTTVKVTVAGNTLPLPPEVTVTPSLGSTLYEQFEPLVETMKLPVPPLAGMVAGETAESVSGHGLGGWDTGKGRPPNMSMKFRGVLSLFGWTRVSETVAGPMPLDGNGWLIHSSGGGTGTMLEKNWPSNVH